MARPAEENFDIVADVECYPEFLVPIRGVRIFNRIEDRYETEKSLALGLLHGPIAFCAVPLSLAWRSVKLMAG